jgi:hypothetical protein
LAAFQADRCRLAFACSTPSALADLFSQMRQGRYNAGLAYNADGEPVAALSVEPFGMFARVEPFERMSDALDATIADRDRLSASAGMVPTCEKVVSNALSRAQNKYRRVSGSNRANGSVRRSAHQRRTHAGEPASLPPRRKRTCRDDYFADLRAKRVIPLDSALSAQEERKEVL